MPPSRLFARRATLRPRSTIYAPERASPKGAFFETALAEVSGGLLTSEIAWAPPLKHGLSFERPAESYRWMRNTVCPRAASALENRHALARTRDTHAAARPAPAAAIRDRGRPAAPGIAGALDAFDRRGLRRPQSSGDRKGSQLAGAARGAVLAAPIRPRIRVDVNGKRSRHGSAGDARASQTLDRQESAFYVGTSSKSLLPTLRLGYIVAPPIWPVTC